MYPCEPRLESLGTGGSWQSTGNPEESIVLERLGFQRVHPAARLGKE